MGREFISSFGMYCAIEHSSMKYFLSQWMIVVIMRFDCITKSLLLLLKNARSWIDICSVEEVIVVLTEIMEYLEKKREKGLYNPQFCDFLSRYISGWYI